jgi:Cof subfamily protein (haloacid dehalogenase superfamily)
MIKVVFFDIDGTLVSPVIGTVSDRVQRAIETIREKDILPVLVSGRPAYTMLPIARQLSIDTYIAYNGGLIIQNGQTIYKNPIDRQVLEQFVAFSVENDHPLIFPGEEQHYVTHLRHPVLDHLFTGPHARKPIFDPDYWKTNDVYQMELVAKHASLDAYRDRFRDQLSFYPWHAYDGATNVNHIQTSKAAALRTLLDVLAIDVTASAAIGDGTNDVEMIQAAGIGIAMGNACDELKAVADHITDDVHQDGVANALYDIVLKA